MDTAIEEWEKYPDSEYDGAGEMTRRGRIEYLENCYAKED